MLTSSRLVASVIFLFLCRSLSGSTNAVLSAASLERKEVQGKGFGVIAKKPFTKGECILQEKPVAYALSAAENAHMTHCHTSLVSSSSVALKRCRGCNYARSEVPPPQIIPLTSLLMIFPCRYASREEQRAAWPSHKLECQRIARCVEHGHTPSSLLLLLGRLLDAKQRADEDGSWSQVMELEHHYGKWSVDQMSIFAQVWTIFTWPFFPLHP